MNEEIERRDFKGIWIPADVWLDTKLTIFEKALLAEIDSLDKGEGCFRSNDSFAKWAGVAVGHIANTLSRLRKKGYLKNINFDGRRRYLRVKYSRHGDNRVKREVNAGLSEKLRRVKREVNAGLSEKLRPNDTTYHSLDNRLDNSKEHCGGEEGSQGSPPDPSTDCFFGINGEYTKFIKTASSKLEDDIRRRHKLNKKRHNRQLWYKEFSLLLNELNGDKNRLKFVLQSYITISHDEFTPVVHSASSFRSKFIQIEKWLARRKTTNGYKAPQIITETVDDEGDEIPE